MYSVFFTAGAQFLAPPTYIKETFYRIQYLPKLIYKWLETKSLSIHFRAIIKLNMYCKYQRLVCSLRGVLHADRMSEWHTHTETKCKPRGSAHRGIMSEWMKHLRCRCLGGVPTTQNTLNYPLISLSHSHRPTAASYTSTWWCIHDFSLHVRKITTVKHTIVQWGGCTILYLNIIACMSQGPSLLQY